MSPVRYSARAFPAYRFVPGRAPHPTRDPRGHSYGAIDDPVPLHPDRWSDCETYLYAVDLFNHGYWWEAHEQLERLWRAADRRTPDGLFVQGLIQVCAALLQHSMGAGATARRKAAAGCAKLRGMPPLYLGIDVRAFTRDIDRVLAGGDGPARLRLRPPPEAPGAAAAT